MTHQGHSYRLPVAAVLWGAVCGCLAGCDYGSVGSSPAKFKEESQAAQVQGRDHRPNPPADLVPSVIALQKSGDAKSTQPTLPEASPPSGSNAARQASFTKEAASNAETVSGTATASPATDPQRNTGAPDKTPSGTSRSASAKTPATRKIELLVKDHKFATEGSDGILRVKYEDLDLLKILNMDPVTPECTQHFPLWLKQLDRKAVRIRGFMAPTFTETNITNFVMARDTQACCFGPNTKIYHLIDIHMKSGKTADYLPFRPLEIEGTFRIEVAALEDGSVYQLYSIDNATVVSQK